MKVRIFNGFVQNAFPARHQTQNQMQTWLNLLHDAAPDTVTLYRDLENCWAKDMVYWIERENGEKVFSADYPNEPPDRYQTHEDALTSQIVLCQRFEWLAEAARAHPEVDIWAWVEGTIFKQSGITAEVVQQFLKDVADYPVDAISLPGMLPKQPITDHINHWRFAGSAWVCPAKYARKVERVMKSLITLRTRETHRLCWDNSSWSYAELLNVLPIRWYPGDHNETQLSHYKIGVSQWPKLLSNNI